MGTPVGSSKWPYSLLYTLKTAPNNGLDAELCPESEVCPVTGWHISIQHQGCNQWSGSKTLSSVRGMPIVQVTELGLVSGACPVLEAEICPVSEVCQVSGWQNSVLFQGYIHCPGGTSLSSVRGITIGKELKPLSRVRGMTSPRGRNMSCVKVAWRQNSVLIQRYVQRPSGRTLSCVRGTSSVRFTEICLASGVCPVTWSQNSVQCQGYVLCSEAEICPALGVCPEGWKPISLLRERYDHCPRTLFFVRAGKHLYLQNFCINDNNMQKCSQLQYMSRNHARSMTSIGYFQCPRGRTLSCVTGMSSVWVAELCPFSGIYPMSGWQISIQRQGYNQWSKSKNSVDGQGYRVSGLQNSVLRQGYVQWPGGRTLSCVRGMSSVRVAELCPDSEVCPASEWQNSVLREGYVQCPVCKNLSCVRGMSSGLEVVLCSASGASITSEVSACSEDGRFGWLRNHALIRPKGVLCDLDRGSEKASLVFEHPFRQTTSVQASMCEWSSYPAGREMGLPRNIAIELGVHHCPECPHTSQSSCF
ncbi:hypothetical protein TNCV_925841 [Trichonephila clavipes]|nr:hypothetical protein TNCV_925841 [Trichonephila clavipes]